MSLAVLGRPAVDIFVRGPGLYRVISRRVSGFDPAAIEATRAAFPPLQNELRERPRLSMPGVKTIVSVVGARPNFMKIAPIIKALEARPGRARHFLVHSGQHYDDKMSGSFFEALQMPQPDVNLGIGSGSHAQQTGRVMMAIEPVLQDIRPDLVIVVGDVNSTLAGALTAKKLQLRVAHVEAGLRSFDMTMPEEVNRLCTDAVADILFTTDRLASDNLKREGIAEAKIHFVGNVMIDSLLAHREVATAARYHEKFGLRPERYGVLTLHRPSNVEDRDTLAGLLDAIVASVGDLPVIFPIHPRTRDRVEQFGLGDRFVGAAGQPGIFPTDPLGYIEFLSLNSAACLVMTDSGGLQEEATILGVPCVTLRTATERPITVSEGTNRIAGTSPAGVRAAIAAALKDPVRSDRKPEKWDGRAAQRIADIILE
jgi:UDP-N-acetylglucosamine 2-epimerase (non-hydrolysing)